MVDAIGNGFLPKKYYGDDEVTQGIGQSEATEEDYGNQTESIYSSDDDKDKKSPYAKAVGITSKLRKISVENLKALGKLQSDKAEALIKEHAAISDECWERLIAAQETADTNPENIENIVQEMQIKFLNLIEKEKQALKETDSVDETSYNDEPAGNRTLAMA